MYCDAEELRRAAQRKAPTVSVLDELREKVGKLERYDAFQNRFGNDRLAEDPKGEYISREEVVR